MLHFVCMSCEDKFIMDEDFVEIPGDDNTAGDGNAPPQTKRMGLDYQGHDCLCPICEKFAGRLIG